MRTLAAILLWIGGVLIIIIDTDPHAFTRRQSHPSLLRVGMIFFAAGLVIAGTWGLVLT